MTLLLAFQLLVVAGGIYALGLIGYRIKLSADSLKKESARLLANLEEIRSAPTQSPEPAQTTRGDELVGLLQKRRQNRVAKEKKAIETERRLIKHLGSMQFNERQ